MPSPHRLAQLCCQPPRTQSRAPQHHRQHLLLQPGRQLIGHPGTPPLPGHQGLQPVPLHQGLPAVVPGAVAAQLPAGPGNPNFAGPGEQPHTVAEDQVIIGHGGPLL